MGFIKRLNIGLMIDDLDGEYQRTIWAGIEETAKRADANVICFAGGEIEAPYEYRYLHNEAYGLISPENIDGLIVASTVMATYSGNEKLREYCRRFEPLPMVSLGFKLPGMTSIAIESQEGMSEVMDHLIELHGFRKFIFLAGPSSNEDASNRQRLFKEALSSHGIEINDNMIKQAGFRSSLAFEVVGELLRQGHDFEAIVAANDDMAQGAMKALEAGNIVLPDQVSVTGFDDIDSSRLMILPLTTVRQPTFEMSKRAAELLLKKINGENCPDLELFKTKLVIRRSCGCFSHETSEAAIPGGGGGEADFFKIKTSIISEIREIYSPFGTPIPKSELLNQVLDAFKAALSGETTKNTFLLILDRTLRQSSIEGVGDTVWEHFISITRKNVIPNYYGRTETLIKAENMLHQSRILIKDMANQIQSNIRFQAAESAKTLQYVIDTLIGSFDLPTLLKNLAGELPKIGIKICYLSLHASEDKKFKEARLLLGFNEKGRISLDDKGYFYRADQLFPRDLLDHEIRYNFIVETLVFKTEQLGFIIFEFNPHAGISSLALSELIRSALKASMMVQEILEKDKELSTLDRLKKDFIANITHDFRSHVTVIMNSAELGRSYDNPENFGEVLKRYETIYNAAVKVKMTIDRLLELASMDVKNI